jgi:hypothetical protein
MTVTLRKLSAAAFYGFTSNRPALANPERPARAVATLVIRPGSQGVAPWLAVAYLCDDGQVRVKVLR